MFLFAWLTHLAGASDFRKALLTAYGFILLPVCFDTFFIDWVIFPNVKKLRLPGTEHMDKEYHQKWFHVKVLLPVLPAFAAAGAVIALVTMWLWK